MNMPGTWYLEAISPELFTSCLLKEVIYVGQTPYQEVQVLDVAPFGRCLVLDGKTQSAECDEHIYHESLVHPVMLLHPQPRTVFIGGGGEGATLREALAHRSVTSAVMVDIDQQVVELCKQHLPNHHQGAFDDPRAQLRIGDARQLLAEAPEQFDVIILDLADPIEGGPAYRLYTQEFYQIAKAKLNPGGLLVTQSGPASPLNHTEAFTVIQHTLASVFPRTIPYSVYVPSFMNPWGFTIAALDADAQTPTPEELDRRIAQRIARPLRFFDGLTCQGLTSLPSFLRHGFAEEKRIATDASPVFVV